MKALMIGDFDLDQFAPTTLTAAAAIGTAVSAGILFNAPGTACVCLAAAWAYRQAKTRHQRDGYWLASPYRFQEADVQATPVAKLNFDKDLTTLYRDVYDTEQVMVSREDASQYNIHVIWHDDINIRSKLSVIARRLGIQSTPGKKGEDSIPVIFVDVWRAGCSALLIQKHPDTWGKPITFNPSAITQGKPRAYIGKAISGEDIIIDHEKEHGALVAGASGSGKTEVFVAHHKSMQLSGLNPKCIVIDLKGTPQLRRLKVDKYITDIEAAIEQMRLIKAVLESRMETYSRHDCDNIWQYRKRVDATEQPYCLYLDELAVLSRAAKAAGKDDTAAEAMDILAALAQLGRSSGLIMMVGMQHPLAEDIPTTIRNQLMIRIVLAVADDSAAKVAGIPGAQNQPMQGAMMVRHGNRIQIGRGAYIESTPKGASK